MYLSEVWYSCILKAPVGTTINLKTKAERADTPTSPSIPSISTNLQQSLLPVIELSTHTTLIFKLHSF